jgi:hypothetical protein
VSAAESLIPGGGILTNRQIEALLLRDRHSAIGEAGRIRISSPVWRGRNAHVYRVEAPWLASPAALKVCRRWANGEPDHRAARRQYDALVKVDAAMGREGRYRVPEPYALFEDAACHLVAWVEGTSLEKELSSVPIGNGHASRLITDAGAWLRHFHDARRLGDSRLDTGKQVADLAELRAIAPERSRQFARTFEIVCASAEGVAAIDVPRSWAHGDYKPANLFTDGQRFYGFDVHVDNSDVVAFDIAQFLNGLAMIGGSVKTRRFAGHMEDFEAAFWDGYAVSPSCNLTLVVSWLRAVLLLSSWSELGHGAAGAVRRVMYRNRHRRALESLMQRLEG